MSRRETPMTLWYWEQIGGTLIEEFPVVARAPGRGIRLLDGLIVRTAETVRLAPRTLMSLRGCDVVIVQAKNNRLGMNLAGQTLFSISLLRRFFDVGSVESVALCSKSDDVLQPMLEAHPGCRVVVCPEQVCRHVLNSHASQ
jgi:hypothetical protein